MPPISPEMLLAGPRGRRLLLEFARSSEQQLRDPEDRAFSVAEFWASYRMAPKASRGSLFGDSTEPTPTVLPADVARVLSETPLLEPTEENLRPALLTLQLMRGIGRNRRGSTSLPRQSNSTSPCTASQNTWPRGLPFASGWNRCSWTTST